MVSPKCDFSELRFTNCADPQAVPSPSPVPVTVPSTPPGANIGPASSPNLDDSPSELALRRRKGPLSVTNPSPVTQAAQAIATTVTSGSDTTITGIPRKRPRTDMGGADRASTGGVDRMSTGEVDDMVTEKRVAAEDKMEMDSLETMLLSRAASPVHEPPCRVGPPAKVEKLAKDNVAANKLVLDHLMAQAAKNVQKSAQKAPPTPRTPSP